MSTLPEEERPKRTGIQVDMYGIKVEGITPRPGKEPAPKSWGEVGRGVNLSLMRFCTETLGLVADIPTAVRAIVRGIGELPGAIRRRVGRAHDKADQALAQSTPEPQATAVAVAEADPRPTPEEGLTDLEDALNALRAQGVMATITRLPTGQWSILLGREELQPQLKLAARKAVGGENLGLAAPAPPRQVSFNFKVTKIDPVGGQSTVLTAKSGDTITMESSDSLRVEPVSFNATPGEVLLSAVGLSKALVHKLVKAGYQNLSQVHISGEANIAAIVGIGPKSLRAIKSTLVRYGLSWKTQVAPPAAKTTS